MNLLDEIISYSNEIMKSDDFNRIISDLDYYASLNDNHNISKNDFIKLFTYGNIVSEAIGKSINLLSYDVIEWSKDHSFSKEFMAMFELAMYKLKNNEELYNLYKDEISIIIP